MKRLLFIAVLAGCGGGETKKETTTPTVVVEDQGKKPAETAPGEIDCTQVAPLSDADAETRGMALVDEMGAVFRDNANDCKALAQAIIAWSNRNQELMNQMNCYTRSLEEQKRLDYEARAQERFQTYGEAMTTAMDNCQGDPDFQKAMQSAVQ